MDSGEWGKMGGHLVRTSSRGVGGASGSIGSLLRMLLLAQKQTAGTIGLPRPRTFEAVAPVVIVLPRYLSLGISTRSSTNSKVRLSMAVLAVTPGNVT